MVLKSLLDKLGMKEQSPEPPAVVSKDGWIEMAGGRIVVHDPQPGSGGKYATITPEGCIRLFINDEEVAEPTAVTAVDRIRYEVAADPVHFFEAVIAPDHMSVSMTLTANPYKTPDTVTLIGQHHARLVPDYSPRARSRPFAPRQMVVEHLQAKGVVFGVDEQAIDAAIASQAQGPIVVARGQEPTPPVKGEWVWRLDELSLAEAGQVIAEYTGDQPNRPRITVLGERTSVFEDLPQPPGYLAGNGTRVVQPGRLVASATGRARAVPAPQGYRVHIFPVRRIEGDLTAPLDLQADLIVMGSILNTTVVSTGEVLVMGGVQQSEVKAETISVRGAVVKSQLHSVSPGHLSPLRAELAWIMERIKAMRSMLLNHQPITEDIFRDVSGFVRGLRRRAEQMAIQSPEFTAVSSDLAKVFMGTQTWTAIDLPTLGRLVAHLEKALKVAEQTGAQARDVRVFSLDSSTVWAGRDIYVEDRIQSALLYAGGAIRTPDSTILSQSELVAGGEIQVGVLSTSRGSANVVLRGGTRIDVAGAQMGSTFEFGGERKVFERDQAYVSATPNAKGQLIFKHRDG